MKSFLQSSIYLLTLAPLVLELATLLITLCTAQLQPSASPLSTVMPLALTESNLVRSIWYHDQPGVVQPQWAVRG